MILRWQVATTTVEALAILGSGADELTRRTEFDGSTVDTHTRSTQICSTLTGEALGIDSSVAGSALCAMRVGAKNSASGTACSSAIVARKTSACIQAGASRVASSLCTTALWRFDTHIHSRPTLQSFIAREARAFSSLLITGRRDRASAVAVTGNTNSGAVRRDRAVESRGADTLIAINDIHTRRRSLSASIRTKTFIDIALTKHARVGRRAGARKLVDQVIAGCSIGAWAAHTLVDLGLTVAAGKAESAGAGESVLAFIAGALHTWVRNTLKDVLITLHASPTGSAAAREAAHIVMARCTIGTRT